MIRWLARRFSPPIPSTPDRPRSFGYKVTWLSALADDPARVFEALQAVDARFARRRASPCNWEHGVAAAYGNARPRGVFFSPPVNGHVLVVEYAPRQWDADYLQSVLGELSARLEGRVCLLGSYRGVSAVVWVVAEAGKLVRGYVHADGTTYLDVGAPLKEERELGFLYYDELHRSGDDDAWDRLPDEAGVLKLAGMLSVDPSRLDASSELSAGLLAR